MYMDSVDKLLFDVNEHTRAIRQFKHDMFMRYNNTNNEEKKAKIIEKISNIYEVMMIIYNIFLAEYNKLLSIGSRSNDVIKIKKNIDIFYDEIISLK